MDNWHRIMEGRYIYYWTNAFKEDYCTVINEFVNNCTVINEFVNNRWFRSDFEVNSTKENLSSDEKGLPVATKEELKELYYGK